MPHKAIKEPGALEVNWAGRDERGQPIAEPFRHSSRAV